MKSSRILTCSAALALGTMLAWGASPAVKTVSSKPAVVQGRAPMAPADQAKAFLDRQKAASPALSDDDATKALAGVTAYYKARADFMAANQGTRPTADDTAKWTDQLKKDLASAGVSDAGVTQISTAITQGGGRRRGGL